MSMSMENVPMSELSPVDEAIYQKSLARNPDLTRADWKEIRSAALSSMNPGVKKFYEKNGILYEEMPDSDTIRENSGKN